ncbi:DUF2946 domain-containing protein [Pseudomonas gingeri]|uniref:DUF2946 domain-containing protein n=1 Tax=Pseudomonas gingeri TaxID=117681 RepID=A0A7Y8C5I2_9PSED|nr:DUF2946 domain-containing protein [Pseudomonas gingeri]NWA25293.1 DUF2946 domain-containing protein [Pseudomonas gingeri]NWB99874.1 DUF2946 domain-containing protein [Pseudomonas gingeri]NWD75046.1 DUF2946 domain-containing protein [Pseudomonas gingeri]
MSRQRLATAWIACFAVLFNLLAMPMSGAMAQASQDSIPEQLLWGSFCSASGTRLVAIDLGKLEQPAPQNDDHSNMQHCWCCAGFATLLGLPGHLPQLPVVGIETHPARAVSNIDSPTPRQQWPSLNPRASPLS